MGATPMSTPKIRIALAGLGFGAEFIPIYLAHPNAEIAAICQRNPEK
jgi:predicted dehydrogenase